jgi:hypothetical protein
MRRSVSSGFVFQRTAVYNISACLSSRYFAGHDDPDLNPDSIQVSGLGNRGK